MQVNNANKVLEFNLMERGSNLVPCSSSSKRGRRRKFVASSRSIRRSVRIRCSRSQSLGKSPDSSTMSGTSESGSGTHFDLGSTYSSYALGNLSASEFSHLASDTTFIFTDIELDREFIRSKEFDRARSLGL